MLLIKFKIEITIGQVYKYVVKGNTAVNLLLILKITSHILQTFLPFKGIPCFRPVG